MEKHGRVLLATNVQTSHAHCTLYTLIYMQTPRISNPYRFPTTITVARTCLDIALHIFLIIITLKAKTRKQNRSYRTVGHKTTKENIIQGSLHAGIVLFLKTLLLG
jgi:hypothetical protein